MIFYYDKLWFWILVTLIVIVLAVLKQHQRRSQERGQGNILWILPDDRQVTVRVDSVLSFARVLSTFDHVSIADINYTVRQTELIIERELKMAVVLE